MKNNLCRVLVYALGLVILALGLVLNTKTGLGSAPLTSPPFVISLLTELPFASVTFLFYCLFVVLQLILHLIGREWRSMPGDLLQLPFALAFTRFMGLFDRLIPTLAPESIWLRLVALAAAIVLIGFGACLSVRMRLIPNPGDGAVLAISERTGWKLGTAKNVFDVANVFAACAIGLIARGRIVGVGLGTVLSMVGVGRVMALAGKWLAPMIERLVPQA